MKGKNKGGRPAKYKPEYAEQAGKACLLGYTDAELAQKFDVDERTINRWKKDYPKFCQSLKKGRDIADEEVSRRLYERAMGYEVKEDVIFQYKGEPVIVPTTKKYPPDPTSMIFWLKNRQRSKWRDKQDMEHSGEVNLITEEPKKPKDAGTTKSD